MSEQNAVTATAPAETDPQLKEADAVGNTWEFEGNKYAKFVANKTGNIGMPILDPKTKEKKIAILGASFSWSDDDCFVEHLNFKLRDERGVRDNETVRKRPNIVARNAKLFDELCQFGYLIKIDEFGEQSEPVEKTRDQMCAYAPEIKSDLIDLWLGKFSVERYYPAGTDDVDLLLSEPESISLLCKIGDFLNPAHVMILEFNTPNADARRAFESDIMEATMSNEGGKAITTYHVNNKAKIRFARKYFKGVKGAVLAPNEAFELYPADFREISDDIAVANFKTAFNPHWMVSMADALADCFDFAGK